MDETERLRMPGESMLDRWFSKRLGHVVGPTGERVHFVHRRHWLVLVNPGVLVTVGCVVVLVAEEPRLWLALSVGGWILLERWRHRWGQLRTAAVASLCLLTFWLTLALPSALFRAVVLVALLVVLLVTIARWFCEALVLTDTSLWKISGVLTTASPKAPLTQILFQDVRQGVVEQALRCGTLSFDTAGASDAPLAHFGPIDDPFVVSAEIHRQRLRSSPAGRSVPPPPPEPPPPPPGPPPEPPQEPPPPTVPQPVPPPEPPPPTVPQPVPPPEPPPEPPPPPQPPPPPPTVPEPPPPPPTP